MFHYHTCIGRNTHFTISERIQSINGDICRNTSSKINMNFYFLRGNICYFLDFDLTLIIRFGDTLHQLGSRNTKRHIPYHQCFFIQLLNMSTYTNFATSFPFIIVRHINHTSCLEIGIDLKLFAFQVFDGSINQLTEIMGKNFGR